MTSNLYREEVLEHFRDPQNFGTLSDATHSSKFANPFCGDEIEVLLEIKENKIQDISFTGKGCAISIAAASMLTEYVKGKDVGKVTAISHEDMIALLEIEVSESRKKCAVLALEAIKDALK